jgi:serine/threonine protein kinase
LAEYVLADKGLVKLSEFEVESKVGSGSFSTVYLATRKGKEYALKQLSKDKLLSTGQMKYALVELRSLILCRGCPYVVPIHFAFQTPDYLYLALSYLPAGDLGKPTATQPGSSRNEDRFPPKKPCC